jgi:hypothetical protein
MPACYPHPYAIPILRADPQGGSHCRSLFRSSPFVISSLLQQSYKITVSDLFAQRSTHNHQQQHSDRFGALHSSDERKMPRNTICTRLSSLAQWLGPEEGKTRGINYPEISKRDAGQEGLWGQIDTEFATRRPPHGSGRHLGQHGRVLKEEPLAHSAAVPLKGASVQPIDRLKL